jgi:hypothetical protein
MKRDYWLVKLVLVFILTWVIAAGPASADGRSGNKNKGEKGEGYKHKEEPERHDGHGDRDGRESYDRNSQDERRHRYFNDEHRSYIHDYYSHQYRGGGCPPGLAKKHNGCMPPGQGKKWAIGRRLPHDVIFYDLPPSILIHLGPVPSQHRFVRVAQDILLITVGTGMVVDAMEDLSWEFGR